MRRILLVIVSLVALSQCRPMPVVAQTIQDVTVQAAAAVLTTTMGSVGHEIPKSMLSNAHGVAIIPNVIKGSFVVGARHGKGLLFIRESDGAWRAPVFIALTGGNIGWQIGVQSSDIILVFKTQRSIQGILSGKLTLGADVAAAAGPVGRQTAVATDETLGAEIYTYSRSRGLFAGVSLDGSVLRLDRAANAAYYRAPAAGQPVAVPPAAQQLTQTIAAYAGVSPANPTAAPAADIVLPGQVGPNPVPVTGNGTSNADVLRQQLVQLAPQLYGLLDPAWQNYLALPPSLYQSGAHPSAQEISAVVTRLENVSRDPQFAQLAGRGEFQSFFAMLKHYQQSLTASPSTLRLPPPPARVGQ